MATKMPNQRLVHLHVHTDHSLIDGLAPVQQLAAYAAEQGYQALAITDHGTLSGAIEFHEACSGVGIKPIIGSELYMAPGSRFERGAKRGETPARDDGAAATTERQRVQFHLTALAATREGYRNLSRLSSLAYLEGFYQRPRVDFELLERYGQGIIVGTGCLSSLTSRAILADDIPGATEIIARLRDIFGPGGMFLECMRHGIPDEDRVTKGLLEIGAKQFPDLRLVATNDSHFIYPSQAIAHTGWLCNGYKKTMDQADKVGFQGEGYWLRGREELEPLFAGVPGALDNTLEIAEQIDGEVIPFSEPIWPSFPLDPPAQDAAEQSRRERELLSKLVYQGALWRYGDVRDRTIDNRIEFELGVIRKMGVDSYFLLVQDICSAARDMGIIIGPGRGSVVGSVVAYCLGIHQLDPLRYGLLFERFLNPERVSMPDIDLDVAHADRDRLLGYIKQRYGEDRVVQIAAFKVVGGRSALRDAARLYPGAAAKLDKIIDLYPKSRMGREYTLAECFDSASEVYEQAAPLRRQAEASPIIAQVLDMAKQFEGNKRDQQLHAAGVLICPGPAIEWTPLTLRRGEAADKEENKSVCSQYNLHSIERLGLLKMDILGLKTLSAIAACMTSLREAGSKTPDLATLPLEDRETYETIASGHTVGVFQLESSSIQELAWQIRPDSLSELADLVALHRPGPMGTKQHTQYAQRKWGQEKVTYKHPELEEVLGDTRGILIYQEQMMLMSQQMAGFSLAEADEMRRVCSKKVREKIEKMRDAFIEGGLRLGRSKELMVQLFAEIEPFAGYGFNRSHAYAYSLITYWTAYLKTHYPAHWMAALLNTHDDTSDGDKYSTYLSEAKRMGLRLLPPFVGRAGRYIKPVDEQSLALSFHAIRGVGAQTAQALIETIDKLDVLDSNTLFKAMKETRGLSKSMATTLYAAGALRELTGAATDSQVLDQIDSIFGGKPTPSVLATREELFDCSTPATRERIMLGTYVLHHPIRDILPELKWRNLPTVSTLLKSINRAGTARLYGTVSQIERRVSKQGNVLYAIRLSDELSEVEALFMEKKLSSPWDKLLTEEQALDRNCMLEGEVGSDERVMIWGRRLRLVHPTMRWLEVDIQPEQGGDIFGLCTQSEGNLPVVLNVLDRIGLVRRSIIMPKPDGLSINEEIIPTLFKVATSLRLAGREE